MTTEAEQRALVVDAARSWVGTRYRNRMAIKGKGVDCAQIILESFREAGVPVDYSPERYASDWHLHRSEERYLSVVTRYMPADVEDRRSVSERGRQFHPLPGDVLMWKVGRTFSHSAIVTEWPYVVHASLPDNTVLEVSVRGTPMEPLPLIHCSYWNPA
jgi:cell wall-associated NlpC family hydrolase